MWWLLLLLTPLLLLLLFLFLISPRLIGRPSREGLDVDYAHRGLHGGDIPENSLPAFARAVEQGFGIELDVQLSADGVIMVFHDDTLARMTGEVGKLCDYTCAQLQTMRLGESDQTIPTFDQVLEVVGGKIPLLIELKGESAGGADALCEALTKRLDSYVGRRCVESFNPMTLSWFRRHRPDIVRGQLVTNTLRERPNGNRFLNFLLAHLMLNLLSRPDFVAFCGKYDRECALWFNTHLFGASAYVWTVKDVQTWQRYAKRGIPSIFEGFVPDRAKENDHA